MQQLVTPHPQPDVTAPRLHRLRLRNPVADTYGDTILLMLPLVALALLSPDPELATWFNGSAPIYLIAITGLAAYRLAKVVPAALWSPAFWLLVVAALFFGFGPLVEIYGNEETRIRLSVQNIAISEVELFKSNCLSFVSLAFMFSGFWLHTKLRSTVWQVALSGRQIKAVVFRPEPLALTFIIGGMIFVHGFLRPSQWGMLDIVVPGALSSIGPIVDTGFAIAAYLALRGSKGMWLVFPLFWPLHLILTALTFSKAALVLALLLPAIGAFLAHRRIIPLAVVAALIVSIYSASQHYVHYGRGEVLATSGVHDQADYFERLRITFHYIAEKRYQDATSVDPEGEIEGWWIRLNYSGAQAIGMRMRSDGVFIDTLSDVWMFFVPRFIWPNKPLYSGPGVQFYELLTGNTGTAVGISTFGDVYWQFGWVGIALIMPVIGWFFAMMAWRSIESMNRQDFISMPIVLYSIIITTQGLTRWLANGIISAIPIYVAYLLLIKCIEWFMRARKRPRQTPPMPAESV